MSKPRLKHIPHELKQWQGPPISKRSLKGILKGAGYSDDEIKKLKAEDRIFTKPSALNRHLVSGQRLYVLDTPREKKPKEPVDRFRDIELD